MDGGHKRGRVFSLTSWYESGRVGRSARRTDDTSAGGKLLFSVTWGKKRMILEFPSFRALPEAFSSKDLSKP